MAKISGLGDRFFIGGYDLSGDVASLDQISGGPALLDVTPINTSAHVRIGGLRDGDMQFTSFFDQASEHAALSALPRADTIASYFRGAAAGNPAASVNGKQLSYDPTRDNTGNLTVKCEVQANGFGMEWGFMLTAGARTDTTATAGAYYDDTQYGTGGTAYGGQAYFHCLGITGTSVTIDVQSCATSGGSYVTTGLTSSAFTATGSQRVAVSDTTSIGEFLKVVTTGTFTSAVFAVVLIRNQTAGQVF